MPNVCRFSGMTIKTMTGENSCGVSDTLSVSNRKMNLMKYNGY